MTQDRFLKIMEHPDMLGSITYEELKTLALAYPYVHNLRYLLAIKAKQDNHPEFARNLALAAAYSLDRTRLFQILAPKKLVPQRVAVLEKEAAAVLELKPIETVQKELLEKTPLQIETSVQRSAKQEFGNAPTPPRTPIAQKQAAKKDEIVFDFSGVLKSRQAENKTGQEHPQVESKDETMAVDGLQLPDPQPIAPQAAPQVLSFGLWAGQFNLPVLAGTPRATRPAQLPQMNLGPLPEKTPAPKSEARILADKSLTENKDLVSETLARLYVRQGYHEKAISMYERLCLAFPEKSHSFAAEIEKLKK